MRGTARTGLCSLAPGWALHQVLQGLEGQLCPTVFGNAVLVALLSELSVLLTVFWSAKCAG